MTRSQKWQAGLLVLSGLVGCGDSSSESKPIVLTDQIVFSRIGSDSSSDLYIMNLDGSNVRLLRDSLGLSLVVPRISPAGDRVAVLGFPSAGGTQSLYMLSRNGAVNFIPNTFGGGPGSWSPDGSKLVFACVDPAPVGGEDVHGICTIDANGDHKQRINHSKFSSFAPSWSPDGTRIAFVNDSAGNHDVYTMNLQGGDVVQLTTSSGGEWGPVWSPDGSKVAYWRQDGINATDPSNVFVVESNGTGGGQVTHTDDAVAPAWTADGSRIGFSSGGMIRTIKPDGSEIQDLTPAAPPSAWPSWGP